jgi:hypothetical protein
MKRFFVLIILGAVATVACTDRDDDVSTVNIRIQNSSASVFQEVRVVGKDTVYENITAGSYSAYLEYDEAFQAMALSVVADSVTFNYFPEIEFTDPLPIGFYTYELFLDESNQLNLNFKLD